MDPYLKTQYDLTNPDIVSAIDDLPLWSAPFGMKLLDSVIMKKNMRVLDVGSGNGFPLIDLSQRLGDTCQLFGIDPWKEAVNRIIFKTKVWNIQNVKILEGKAEELPFENGYFDLVVSNNGINNVENEEKALFEIARVSKTGAQMVITENLPKTMIEFYSVFEDVLKKRSKNSEIDKLNDHVLTKRKPLSYMKELIRKVGFNIVNIFEDSFFLRYLDGSSMFNHYFIKLGFMDSWKDILKKGDVNPIFKALEEELNNLSQQRGELRLTIPWVCLDCRKN